MAKSVTKVRITIWKPTPNCVSKLAEHVIVQEAANNCKPTVTVIQMLDSLLYMGRTFDGSMQHPVKEDDGKFHVVGDLVLADKSIQFNIYKALKPILVAAGTGPLVLITPMSRYLSSRCCDNVEHLTNASKLNFRAELEDELAAKRQLPNASELPGFLFPQPHPHHLKLGGGRGAWELDPVHPSEGVYDNCRAGHK